MPLAVSPVVVGVSLFLLYGRGGWFYNVFEDHGIQILFSLPAMVIATMFVTMFVSLPFVAREVVPTLRESGDEQEQAAHTLGANGWQTFRRIAVPLAKPVLALVFFFSFVADWNNFFLPYVLLADSNQYPITVGLDNLLASTPSFNPAVGGGVQSVNIFKPELALATLIAVVPVAIVFLVSQRALVRGILGGAVKH